MIRDFPIAYLPSLHKSCSEYLERLAADPGLKPVPTRPAATVMIVRDGDAGLEVFLLRRVSTMQFAPNSMVFPGGGVDPRDDADLQWAGPGPVYWAARLGCNEHDARKLVVAAVLAGLLALATLAALPHVDLGRLTQFAPAGWAAVGSAAALLVWAFAGWEAVTSLSGDYRDPGRDIPRATAVAVAVIAVLYLGIAFTTVTALADPGPAPLSDLLALGFGEWARPATTVIAVLLTIGAINSYFAGASRLGASLAITGAMPRWLGSDIGDGRATPRHALLVVAGLGLTVTVGEALLGQPTDATLLITTGTFALVYVVGTAAAVRLLPGGWPRVAAVSSFVAFAVGAAVPVLPYLLGSPSVWPAVVATMVALFGCGAVVTQVTVRPWWYGGARQMLLGAVAAAVTYFVGSLVGAGLG